jgi:thiopeptide-type bacteriocin biosynthesis protein
MDNIQRDFILGDDWFYFKIYTGVKTADTLLIELIEPLTKKIMDEGLIDKWFFIRYSDPEFHLRIRFRIKNKLKLSEIILELNKLLKPFIENRLVSTFQTETYSREIERYGGKTIEDAESFFFHDSQMTIQMLGFIEGDEGENYRWHFACLAIDYLLNDFGFSQVEKLQLMDNLQQGFGQEFGMNTQLKVQLDDKFRKERQQIRVFLLKENDFYQPFYQILEHKSINTKEIIKKIRNHHSTNKLEVELNNLISSYIHMMLNRIFKSKQRLNEMVIYSLMYRFYKSEMARNKKALLT